MSSAARSSSGVRDLRAMFEKNNDNSATTTPDRGRSPPQPKEAQTPNTVTNRRVRSNFVTVDQMSNTNGNTNSTAGSLPQGRRESFSMSEDKDPAPIAELKQTVSNEYERRKSIPGISEVVPEHAVTSSFPTPVLEADEDPFSSTPQKPIPLPSMVKQSEHTEKKTSAIEDVNAKLKPVNLTSPTTISPPKVNATKSNVTSTKVHNTTTAVKQRPSNVSTHSKTISAPAKPSPKSPASVSARSSIASKFAEPTRAAAEKAKPSRASLAPSTSPPSKQGPREPTRPVNLPAHLTAQTTSSAAKHEPEPSKKSLASSSKPVDVPAHLLAPTTASRAKHEEEVQTIKPAIRKSADVPAHLLAPTAASKAKHEDETKPQKRERTSILPLRPAKPVASTSSRTSIAPQLDGTLPAKPTAPPSEGFLARMTKATAASSNKTSDKLAAEVASDHLMQSNTASTPSTNETHSRDNKHNGIKKPSRPSVAPSVSRPEPTKTNARAPKLETEQKVKDATKVVKEAKKPLIPSTKKVDDKSAAEVAANGLMTSNPPKPQSAANLKSANAVQEPSKKETKSEAAKTEVKDDKPIEIKQAEPKLEKKERSVDAKKDVAKPAENKDVPSIDNKKETPKPAEETLASKAIVKETPEPIVKETSQPVDEKSTSKLSEKQNSEPAEEKSTPKPAEEQSSPKSVDKTLVSVQKTETPASVEKKDTPVIIEKKDAPKISEKQETSKAVEAKDTFQAEEKKETAKDMEKKQANEPIEETPAPKVVEEKVDSEVVEKKETPKQKGKKGKSKNKEKKETSEIMENGAESKAQADVPAAPMIDPELPAPAKLTAISEFASKAEKSLTPTEIAPQSIPITPMKLTSKPSDATANELNEKSKDTPADLKPMELTSDTKAQTAVIDEAAKPGDTSSSEEKSTSIVEPQPLTALSETPKFDKEEIH